MWPFPESFLMSLQVISKGKLPKSQTCIHFLSDITPFLLFRPIGKVGEVCSPSNAYYLETPDYTPSFISFVDSQSRDNATAAASVLRNKDIKFNNKSWIKGTFLRLQELSFLRKTTGVFNNFSNKNTHFIFKETFKRWRRNDNLITSIIHSVKGKQL